MANMSYCRFENTSKDMQDCWNALAEVDDIGEWFNELSKYEQHGFRLLMRLSGQFTSEIEPALKNAGIKF